VKETAILLVSMLTLGAAVPLPSEPPQDSGQRQVVIVVVGAPGTPEYARQFAAWAGLWERACAKSHAQFTAVGLDESAAPSDRARIQQILAEQSGQVDLALWLVLIGHGTFDGRAAKFNLRGPDLSANDLAEWLKPVRRPVAVINTASSSAPFLKELSGPGRIAIAATKSGFEHNYTRFGQYLAEAIVDPGADLDKDGQTSLLEAFLSASHAVAEFYAAAGRLATEHALLDDNGDTLGTPADWFRGIRPAPPGQRPVQKVRGDASGSPDAIPRDREPSIDGYRAAQLHLLHSPREAAMPPDLRARRDLLELQVMELRDARAQFSQDEYFSRLEGLLCEIARIYGKTDESGSSEESR